jgi:hypothetical protein
MDCKAAVVNTSDGEDDSGTMSDVPYLRAVGSLMYRAQGTTPDIAICHHNSASIQVEPKLLHAGPMRDGQYLYL